VRFSFVALLVVWFVAEVSGQPLPVASIAGQPFSADEVNIENPTPNVRGVLRMKTIRVYRDSAGRTRVDASVPHDPTAADTLVRIDDPVAGIYYSLDTRNKSARRLILPGPRVPPSQTLPTVSIGIGQLSPSAGSGEVHTSSESLGAKFIGGLAADGQRITRVYAGLGPMSACEENVAIKESWYSPELQMTLLESRSNCFGDGTTRLENIDRTEPDEFLFQIPSDYVIVDVVQERRARSRNSPPSLPPYTLPRLPPPETK